MNTRTRIHINIPDVQLGQSIGNSIISSINWCTANPHTHSMPMDTMLEELLQTSCRVCICFQTMAVVQSMHPLGAYSVRLKYVGCIWDFIQTPSDFWGIRRSSYFKVISFLK